MPAASVMSVKRIPAGFCGAGAPSNVKAANKRRRTAKLLTSTSSARSHGRIGIGYKGRVQQIVTGSIGFDDWEWGVTLFADDALPLKKIVQEMRFDEGSALYGEFGPFFVGVQMAPEQLAPYLLGTWPETAPSA